MNACNECNERGAHGADPDERRPRVEVSDREAKRVDAARLVFGELERGPEGRVEHEEIARDAQVLCELQRAEESVTALLW